MNRIFQTRIKSGLPSFCSGYSKLKIENLKFFLLILVVVFAWFSPWWAGGRNLAPLDLLGGMMSPWRGGHEAHDAKNHIVTDGVDQYLVYRMIAEKSYREEGWVGWSSLTYGGTAQYANTMALYDDWTMQLHRWFDFWTAWHLGLMAQVWIAAWGMMLFLRGRSIGGLWACCGALAYAANSQFVTWIYHRWALGAFCWVPWILWAIDRHRAGRRYAGFLVPVFLGMAFLGGTLQHAALVMLVIVAMWAEEAWVLWGERNRVSRSSSSAAQTLLLGRYVVWGLLGMGLAGMMFLPCVDAFLTCSRLHMHTGLYGNAENSVYPQGCLQPLFNLAAYPFQILPSVLGRCNSIDVLKLFKSELWYVMYFGSLPVLIAYLAAWRKESPLLARLLIGFGLLLPLTPLVRVLYQRMYLLFVLGGILAFAHFMENALRETRLKVFRVTAVLTGILIAGWICLSVLLHTHVEWSARLRNEIISKGGGSTFGYFSDWMAGRADRFIEDLSIWSPHQCLPLVLFCAALVGLRITASAHPAWRRSGSWFVLLVVVCEISLFGSRWVVWTDPPHDPLFPATAETEALQRIVGHEGRVSSLIHPSAHMACTPFVPNTLAPYGIATIGGYDSIFPNGMVLPNEYSGDAKKLGRLGVSHLITWPGNPDVGKEWKPVWSSRLMELYENTRRVPKLIGFRKDADKDAFFDKRGVELVALRETSGKENSRTIEVPAGIRWIRLAENHGDGWEFHGLKTDDWMPVLRAADAGMLIKNPDPGTASIVEMRYKPPLRRFGFMLSGISLSFVLGGLVVSFIRRSDADVQVARS